MSITISAPGKLMLMGEHAVVFGKPSIVTAVNHRIYATLETISEPKIILNAPEVGLENYQKALSDLGTGQIPKESSFVEHSVKNFIAKYPIQNGLQITTKAGFSSKFGFGSSSAVTVCVVKGLSEIFGLNLSNQEIFEISYKTVLDVQGKGSGFDIAAAVWGGTILFQNKGEVVEPLDIPNFDLVVGYTGKKYETVKVLDEVKATENQFPDIVQGTYSNIEILVQKAVAMIKTGDDNLLQNLGMLMNFNQGQLDTLGVNCLELAEIIYSAREAGAFGSKLSGSGKGDCAVALVDNSNKSQVAEAISQKGYEVIDIVVNAEGARVES
jgi:mevalonate kinase